MSNKMDSLQISPNSIEMAGRMIDKYVNYDSSYPTLIDLAGINNQLEPTASGLTDSDYPNLLGVSKGFANISQLKTVNKLPLPPEVVEHFGHVQCHCMMGLFTEINRAWLTIDSDIYVWTYEYGSDLAYFDGLGETIVGVGLIKPKPGVFHNFIKYLLVLATTVEIVVLGVTFSCSTEASSKQQEEIHLVPEPVFVIPTDGITISTIVGTNTGRIFLGGRDGSLFEIYYQAEGSWFGKRCKKINHSTGALSFFFPSFLSVAFNDSDPIIKICVDNSRNILYTLTEKGSIEVFDLGETGASTSRVTKLSQATIVQNALHVVKTLDSPNFRPIVDISVLEISDSPLLNLVAVTQTGVRFYFTTCSLLQTNIKQRPSRLQLLHVRLPPGFSANSPTLRPKMIHLAHYRRNSLFMISSHTSDQDQLWCLSNDQFSFCPRLMEAYTVLPLDGSAWAMAEVSTGQDFIENLTTYMKKSKRYMESDPPIVVRQHLEPPRKLVVLTAQGTHIIHKLRPIDLLRQLLLDGNGPENETVKAYFHMQKEDQACATCLVLACLENSQNAQLAEWATRAFFMYGGEPRVYNLSQLSNQVQYPGTNISGFNPALMSTPMPVRTSLENSTVMPQFIHSTSPQATSFVTGVNTLEGVQMIFSPKHDGLYLYVGRILRPLWDTFCVQKISNESTQEFLVSTVSAEDCVWILSSLKSFRNFLDKNTQLAINSNLTFSKRQEADTHDQSLYIMSQNTTRMNTTIQDAQLEEKQSLDALKIFVKYACEVVGLWKILCEHQFHVIVNSLSKDHQVFLQDICFRDLIINGHELISGLVVSLINSYLNDNASVDSISAKLRDVCPALYRNEDAACSKANEILLIAKNKQNAHEKEEMLHLALKLCKDVAPYLNLHNICQQFSANQFYEGLLDLCVACAKKIDNKDIGIHYYKNKEPVNDQEGYQAYAKRMECYKEITVILDSICDQNIALNSYNESNIQLHRSFEGSKLDTTTSESYRKVYEIIQNSLQYDDELLHIAIYEWMIARQMYGDLIAISQPSLESYLLRAAQHSIGSVHVYDLLWKYYERNNKHPLAAKVLNTLAMEPGTSITLAERIEYLARSVICMRSDKVGCAAPMGVFLRELEDRIQIARVQQKILHAIENIQGININAQEAITKLNSQLYDVTELYEEFAERYGLWDCKLAIIHCSGHSEPALVQNIWKNIIKKELDRSHGSANDKMERVLNKVKVIYLDYGNSSNCFPLYDIISLLEINSATLNADATLVPTALVSMEIPMNLLIEAYNSFVKKYIGEDENKKIHVYKAASHLILVYTEKPNLVVLSERIVIKTKAQDIVSSALSSLYSKPNSEELIKFLRNIQMKLDRI